MHLLFSLTYYTPYVSGLTLYVKRLAEALAKKSYQVSVISFRYDDKLPERDLINGVGVIRVRSLLKISKGFVSLDWLLKSWQEVREADVVLINLPQFEGLIPAIIGKLFGKKVISIYHCEVDLPVGILNIVVEWLLHLLHFITLSISDRVITYTKDFAEKSKLLPHFKSKLLFVYPPITSPKLNKSTQKILKRKILGSDLKCAKGLTLIIGVAARLAAEKGIEYLFEALPQIKLKIKNEKLKIVVAGSLTPVGERTYKEKIMKLVEKYKDYVVFLGELKEEDMGSFYSLLDVLALPSINSTEGFGMVQIEAMMMGVPVVASDLPGVRIPIKETKMGILVPIKNPDALASAIYKIYKSKNDYLMLVNKIKQKFSFARTINSYDRILRS